MVILNIKLSFHFMLKICIIVKNFNNNAYFIRTMGNLLSFKYFYMQKSNYSMFTLSKRPIRLFSNSASNFTDKREFDLDALIKKTKAFQQSTKDLSNELEIKNKMESLKAKEFEKSEVFYMKHAHYLSKDEFSKGGQIIKDAEVMDGLLDRKFQATLDFSKTESIEKAMKVANFSYTSKDKTFNTLNTLIKDRVSHKLKEGSISQAEADIFNIELAKRNLDKLALKKKKTHIFKNLQKNTKW